MPWVEKAVADWTHWDLVGWALRPLPEESLSRFRSSQDSFDIQFLEDLLVRLPDHTEILVQLGQLYTQAGRYREGLAVDRRLVALKPRDPIAYYNLACSHSLMKQSVRALAALRRSIELGYRDVEHMQADPDLENLRNDPRWNELLGVVKL
jgi:tetratricopeptide (TPR) repeat protein